MLKLTVSTIDVFTSGFPITRLSKIFQDVVVTTRNLDFRYLWIDALCIIQDSPEDWEHESIHMGETYSGAILSLAATASLDSTRGFLPRPTPASDICVQPKWPDFPGSKATSYRMHSAYLGNFEVGSSILNSRSWVLQEMHPPPPGGILHFTAHKIWWSCAEITCNEQFPGGIPTFMGCLQFSNIKQLLLYSQSKPSLDSDEAAEMRAEAINNWLQTSVIYSQIYLTKPIDRMIAISGLAKLLHSLIGDGVSYHSGVWSRFLLER